MTKIVMLLMSDDELRYLGELLVSTGNPLLAEVVDLGESSKGGVVFISTAARIEDGAPWPLCAGIDAFILPLNGGHALTVYAHLHDGVDVADRLVALAEDLPVRFLLPEVVAELVAGLADALLASLVAKMADRLEKVSAKRVAGGSCRPEDSLA